MSLKDRITEDMKSAMRAKDTTKLGAIRMLLAAVKQKEVDERVAVDDTMLIALVDKLIKQRKDAHTQFAAAGRNDLAEKESAEIDVLAVYLPVRLDAAAIATEVMAIVTELGATGASDMGKVIGAAKAKLAGKVDMALVSAAVKKALAG